MKVVLMCIIGLMCLNLSANCDVEVRCKQDITIVGKTKGECSILFYYSNWKKNRRCGHTGIYILFLSRDGAVVFDRKYTGIPWANNYLKNLETDSSILIEDSNGVYFLSDSVYFKPPQKDTAFSDKFWSLPKCDAETWNWEYRKEYGYDPPAIHGADWNLIYRHNEGVYKNYMIREVYYYPNSNYVVINTLQPQLDETNKTMDGLMIFYLK